MKLRFGLLSIWVAVAVYSIGSFIYGPTGLIAMQHLELQKEKLTGNMEELELIRQNLTYSVDSLLYDRETLEILARDLGYGKPNESFIRISGTDSIFKNHFVVGGLVTPEQSIAPLAENQLRFVALISGVVVFLLCLLLGKRERS